MQQRKFMNTVIIGAGAIGLHIASLLSKKGHNVILIDINRAKLEEMSWQMDVAIKEGSGTDWQLLDDLLEIKPDLFLALTSSDEVNLTACSIAKQLGYPRTIARVRDNRFLNKTRLDFGHLFHVDYFICPELLVAYDIYKYLIGSESIAVESFAHGSVQMRTIKIPSNWKYESVHLTDLKLPKGIMIGLIHRKMGNESRLIFPHGDDTLQIGDEVTLVGEREQISEIHHFFGINTKPIHSVVIMGGSLIGINLAKILQEKSIEVKIIDKDPNRCLMLAEELPKCRILHEEGTNLEFLRSERFENADFFLTCTSSDELNVLGGMIAKEAGCQQVITILSNEQFVPLVNRMGFGHVISPKIAAANQIFSLATSKAITSLVALYDNQAEVIEINVSPNSKVIGIPLAELGPKLPKDFLIAMIQNRGRAFIPKGDSVIHAGDVVIVICHAKHLNEIEKIF